MPRKELIEAAQSRVAAFLAGAVRQASTAELEALCGPLPGTDETREIISDAEGALVTVTAGEDVRSWRCSDGAWIELPSEQ